jgi:diguanylate cyclase (GGDEF)-like protein
MSRKPLPLLISALQRCLLAAGLACLLAFAQAMPAGPAPRVAAPAPMSASDARAELNRAQHLARAQPEAAARELRQLAPRLAAEPALQVEALMTLGGLHALLDEEAAMNEVAERLRAWPAAAASSPPPTPPATPPAALARLAAVLVEALARVDEQALPSNLRLRLVSQHASLLADAGRFEPAVRRLQAAIALADANEHAPWERADLRATLAYTLHQAGEKERARELVRAALALAREAGDHKSLASIHTTLGILLTTEAHGQSSPEEREAMRAAVEHARLAGARRDEVLALANLADLHLRHGDYRAAIAQSERALPLAHALRDHGSQSVALANIGLAQIMLGRKAEGLRHVRASIAIDERMGAQASLSDMHAELGHYLERAGHAADAYRAYREHRRLATELFQRDLQRQLAELRESYEHEQRQRELDLLERAARLQRSELLAAQLKQGLWIGGALLALVLFAAGALLLRRLREGNRALARTNEQLNQLARRDALTGLANRRHFQAAVHEPRGATPRGLLMLIDIDHFKQINDRFGHAAGDTVLVEVARRLRGALRDDDLIVRWGGEEFLVHVPAHDNAAADEANRLARRLLRELSRPVAHGAIEIPVSASIGFAPLPLPPAALAPSWDLALELVDTAMYLAKAHGRHRAYGIERCHAADVAELARLGRDLEAAWRLGQVELSAIEGDAPGGAAHLRVVAA